MLTSGRILKVGRLTRLLVLVADKIGRSVTSASVRFNFRFRVLGKSLSSDGFEVLDLVFNDDGELDRSIILLFDLIILGEGASLLDTGGSRTCCKSVTSKEISIILAKDVTAFCNGGDSKSSTRFLFVTGFFSSHN